MLRSGILNPAVNSLLSRVRHTNLLVIADRGFPFFPQIETVDLSLVDDLPKVLDVWRALIPNFSVGAVYMAEEFLGVNQPDTVSQFRQALGSVALHFEPHVMFKSRIPSAIGLIRTGDTVQYANMILESA